MANEVRSFQATFPAGTDITSPLTINMGFPPRTVDTLELVIPPGPSGLMGFRITMGGTSVIPIQPGIWLITDDERITWKLDGYPNSGAWQIQGYNTDEYDHSVYLRWLVNVIAGSTDTSLVPPVTLGSLNPAPTIDAALAGGVVM
jgi:hypothetical protein